MSEEEYKALYGRKFSDLRMVKSFRIKYAIPEQVFTLLDTLKSEVGRVLVEPDSGTALIMDTPENVKRIEETLATMEQKNAVKVFALKYAKAKDVEEQLKTQLDAKKVGMVKADERSNQVIVQTLPDRMIAIENLIASLDKKTKEVLIDTKIVKVKLTNQSDTGVSYEGLFSVGGPLGTTYTGSAPYSVLQQGTAAWQSRQTFLDSQGGAIGAYPFSGNTSSTNSSSKVVAGQNMHFGVISGQRDFDLLINYLQTIGSTQILSNPKLAVTNNQEARIHVGERQAYVTTTTTTGQTTTTVSEEVTFVDVGIQLSVTPTINDDGYVTMKVKPEISSVVDTLVTPSGNKIPIIDSSMAETTVMVKDGSTIIIGGLRREDKVSNSSGLPFLSKLPILGFIFRSKTDSVERTELLVMITPHIVGGEQLTTGDDREFGSHPGKAEKQYPAFTAESAYNPQEKTGALEENIKPYKEYSDVKDIKKEEENSEPTIKGEDGR
jgi:type II secretory pathway component GspD/PulD (secretin)